jgi:CubicO group peptidase (beta-lactamase class C family)
MLGGCDDDTRVEPSPLLDAGAEGAPTVDAPAPPAALIDDLLAPVRASSGVPGVAAVVLRGGAVVAEGASGTRRLGDPTPIGTQDDWFLGESAQTMTASLAALVVEQGKLSWTSTLGAVLPDVPMHASYTNVTLEALLGHRGGAPAKLPDPVDQAMRVPGDPQARRTEAVRTLLATAPELTPGTEVRRSGAGYLFAALMLERATGTSWEQLVRDRLFTPLGMTGCTFDGRGASAGVVEPWGHVTTNSTLQPVAPGDPPEPPAAYGPAGRVRCPLRDWAKLAALHLAGARAEPTPLLSAASFLKLDTPVQVTQALGWNAVARSWAGEELALVEESEGPLFVSVMWIAPAKNVAFLVVANESDAIALATVDKVVGQLIDGFVPR